MQTLSKLSFAWVVVMLCLCRLADAQTPASPMFYNRIAAISSSSPDVFGRGYLGTIGIGGALQNHSRLGAAKFDPDGNIVATVGLGNPEKLLGVDLQANWFGFGAVGGRPDNFGEGTLDLHFSRMIDPDLWIGVGGYNLVNWIAEGQARLQSYYGSATAIFHLRQNNRKAFSTLFLTLGAGNGKFRNDEDYDLINPGSIGMFGSAALQVFPEGNFIVEWTGYNFYSGISIMPSKELPWQVIFGIDDIFHEKRHLIVGTSFGFHLFGGSYQTKARMATLPAPPSPQPSRI